MAKKSVRPKIFVEPEKYMNNIKENLIKGVLDSGMKAIHKAQPKNIKAKRKPRYLELTEERMNNLEVIDLKPYFARSPNAERKKDGGWYLVVPIQRSARGMSRRGYEELRAINITPDEQRTVISSYLYDKRKLSDASMLNYTPRSNNITKIKSGKNRHSYVAFRTVSNTSPASSWIVNRAKVNSKDTSKTFISNVNRLMKWKMKNS